MKRLAYNVIVIVLLLANLAASCVSLRLDALRYIEIRAAVKVFDGFFKFWERKR